MSDDEDCLVEDNEELPGPTDPVKQFVVKYERLYAGVTLFLMFPLAFAMLMPLSHFDEKSEAYCFGIQVVCLLWMISMSIVGGTQEQVLTYIAVIFIRIKSKKAKNAK